MRWDGMMGVSLIQPATWESARAITTLAEWCSLSLGTRVVLPGYTLSIDTLKPGSITPTTLTAPPYVAPL